MTLTSYPPAREHASAAADHAWPLDVPRYAGLGRKIAALVPALALFNPVLLWQVLYAEQLATLSTFAVLPGSDSTYLLTKIWFPPLLMLAAVAILCSGKGLGAFRLSYLKWWILLFVWAALSVVWAIAPQISFVRVALQVIIWCALAMSFIACRQPDDIIDRVFWVLVVTAMINFATVLFQNPGPLGYEGIYQHKNELGVFACCAILVAILKFPSGGWITRVAAVALIPICLILLVLSTSKTSAGLLPIVLALGFVTAFFSRYIGISPVLTLGLFLLGLCSTIAILDGALGISPEELADMITGDATFTGRTGLWDFAWEHYLQRPLAGHGFKSFWNIGVDSPSLALGSGFIAMAKHGHNGYLDILLGGGAIALLLFVPVPLIAIHKCGQLVRRNFAEGAALLSLMFFFIFHNLLESSFFDGPNFVFMLFQIFWLYAVFSIPDAPPARPFPSRRPQ